MDVCCFFHVLNRLDLKNCSEACPCLYIPCLCLAFTFEPDIFLPKALPALIEQGDGFSQVLKMQPVIQLQRINQEVFSSCYRRADTKPHKSVTQIETTPTETAARKASNIVLKRKHASDCSQRKCYPLRLKRINLDG